MVASRAFGVDLATAGNGWTEYAASDDHESNLAPRKEMEVGDGIGQTDRTRIGPLIGY